MGNGHAKLSPSAAKRWMSCPGSVRLSANVLDAGSKASDQGTAGHLLFEKSLRLGKQPKFWLGETLEGVKVTQDMVDWVTEAVRWVESYLNENPGSILFNEQKVNIGPVFGLEGEELYGTCDLVIISPRRLVVFDLKLGYVDVEVERNPQLMLYALGFLLEHAVYEFEEVQLVIHQPRSGGAKEDTVALVDMAAARAKYQPKVLAALDPNAPLIPANDSSDDYCRWCPAAASCPARKEIALAAARREFADIETITRDELAEVLKKADLIRSTLKTYEAHALKLLELGQKVPGFKRVKGRKNRVWKSEDEAKKVLKKLGYTDDDIAPRSVITPAQGEKLIGRGGKELLKNFIETPEGEPTLAPESDPRPALPGEFEEGIA